MPFEAQYTDSESDFNIIVTKDAIWMRRGFWKLPQFKDEPATVRGAFLMLASLGRVVRATIPDLSSLWGLHERKTAQMVRRMERLGLISVAGSGRCRLICVERSDLVQTCGFHVMGRAKYPSGAGGGKWRGAAMPKALRDKVIKRDGLVCAYCGTTDAPMHIDHIKPVSKGGTDAISNLTVACAPCNLSKGGKSLADWRESQ